MRIAEALREAESLATSASIPVADFHFLLSELTGLNNVELMLERETELDNNQQQQWKALCQRRLNGEPSQYIIGRAYFFGLEQTVNPAVLIPRPETEGLVELILKHTRPGMRVLDIGTGCGAIALALKSIRPDLLVTAVDISVDAISVASDNAGRLGLEIDLKEADLFPQENERFDLIISNPPYISKHDYDRLPVHIREHEPQTALLAAEDGLIYYRRILEGFPGHAGPGALLAFEIGSTQADAIKAIARKQGLEKIEIFKDPAGLDRYVLINT